MRAVELGRMTARRSKARESPGARRRWLAIATNGPYAAGAGSPIGAVLFSLRRKSGQSASAIDCLLGDRRAVWRSRRGRLGSVCQCCRSVLASLVLLRKIIDDQQPHVKQHQAVTENPLICLSNHENTKVRKSERAAEHGDRNVGLFLAISRFRAFVINAFTLRSTIGLCEIL